jgi:hypothetical protein
MLRSIALIVILAATAFGLDRLNIALKAAPPVMSGDAGAVLYAAGFDALAEEWQTFDDGELSARVVADDPTAAGIRLRAEKMGVAVSSAARWHFADFDYSVMAAAVGGPENNGYGVVFRYTNPDNTYAFHISSDGYYRVVRTVDGVSKDLSTWIRSDLINAGIGAVNTVRVIGEGGTFQFFINEQPVQVCLPDDPTGTSTYAGGQCVGGQMLDTLTDSSFPSGKVGVTVSTPGDPDVEAAFDNVVVVMPE